jgi:ELWxxDGT repeat protein
MPSPFLGFADPGSSRSTALDTTLSSYIGGAIGSTPNIFKDSLSSLDTIDFYQFKIGGSSASAVSLRLDGLSQDARLQLQTQTGSTLQTANFSGTASELLTRALDPGDYFLRVDLLATGSVSTNYDLSFSAEVIPTIDNGGNTASPRDIGSLNNGSPFINSDFVGNRGTVIDNDDYYQFNTINNGTLNLTLNGLGGNADVELYNASGTKIAFSTQTYTTSESISKGLTSGTYFVKVLPSTFGATNYTLNLNFNAEPADLAGNVATAGAARNINPLTSTASTYTDFVNDLDTNDYYKFDFTSSALVNLTLIPTNGNADVQLLNSSGGTIVSSNQTATTPDSINRSLIAGTYYIRVFPVSGAATNYSLSVSATGINPDIAPNTTGTAKNIGTLNGSQNFNDFVGNIDADDYYKFTIANTSDFTLALGGLIGNADVDLLRSNGSLVKNSQLIGNASESISTSLAVGDYYVRIKSVSGANTFYNLSLSAQAPIQMLQISPGAGSSTPDNLTALGNTLYFTANDSTNGVQLWKSDGTSVSRITSTNPSSFQPANLTVLGNNLVFTADDGVNGKELWVYNGTIASMVSNINPGAASSNPSNLTAVDSKLFFTADDGSKGKEIWVYDGTAVSLVKDIYSGSTGSNPANLAAFNGKVYFAASDGIKGTELWSSDGTLAGTTLVQDIRTGITGSSPGNLTVVGNKLYFTADNGTNGIELWKYESGAASIVKDITPNTGGFGPTLLTAVGNTLYFVADSTGNFKQQLWKSDGTDAGTVRVKNNLAEAPNLGFGPIGLTATGSTLYFTTNDPATGLELWKSDGTDTGTKLVSDIWTGTNGANPNSSFPDSLVNFNGSLYFAASEPTNGREVWSSDGTALGTRRVSNINPATGDASPAKLTAVGTRLFFTASDGTNGTELWVI